MFRKVFKESIKDLVTNPKLIRVAFWTGFFQNSFVLIGDIIYYGNNILNKYGYTQKTSLTVVKEFLDFAVSHGLGIYLFVIVMIFFFGIVILNVIGKNMTFYVMDTGNIQLKKSMQNYFLGVVVLSLVSLFSFSAKYFILAYQLVMMNIMDNVIMQVFIGIILFILIVGTILTPFAYYVAMSSSIDSTKPEQKARNAMSESASLVGGHIGTTIKFTVLQFVLQIRFLLNLAFVLGLPALLGYVLYALSGFSSQTIMIISSVFAFVILVFVIYVNTFVETFFMIFRYKLYKQLLEKETENQIANKS